MYKCYSSTNHFIAPYVFRMELYNFVTEKPFNAFTACNTSFKVLINSAVLNYKLSKIDNFVVSIIRMS